MTVPGDALLREILDCSSELIWAVEPQRFRLIAFNRRAAEAALSSSGAALREGMTLEEVHRSPGAAALWRGAYERALGHGSAELEAPLCGDLRVRATLTCLARGGRPQALAVHGRDVAEERHVEEVLRRREAFFRKVLEESADVTSVLAADGRRIFISSGVTQVLGYTEDEALSLKMAESAHPDDQARMSATFKRILSSPGSGDRIRFRQRHKGGAYVVVDAMVRNACDDPDVRGVVVNTRDVTEQVRLEEQFLQAQKLESVGRLAGGIAHDFNNLLTVILSCTELLQAKAPISSLELVEEILAAAERARGLTRQLLAFARKQIVTLRPLDLTAQVRASETLLRRLVNEDVELAVDLEPELWPVMCDAGQIDQVLFNLVVNARDAMPRGGRITLLTANAPRSESGGGQDFVRLVVRDNGVGISADVQMHLFEPFFTTKPTGQGTGLGLATVHGIVRQHGGRVEVESAPGRGSAFSVLLPRCPTGATAGEPRLGPRSGAGFERILLVEDDPPVRRLAENALVRAGYRVVAAADGETAQRLLCDPERAFDLVVTDVVLPGADGLTVAKLARKERPAIRVMFTSGYPADRLSTDGVVDPDIDLLPKPFTPSALLQRVRAALDRRLP